MTVIIRAARSSDADADAIWAILEPVIRAGKTYALPRDWDRRQALAYWFAPGHAVFVAEDESGDFGCYYLHANQLGGGDHVAGCGYMVRHDASGRGVAATICRHSMDHARAAGSTAMRSNFVVSTNERAVALGSCLDSRSWAGRLARSDIRRGASSMPCSCFAPCRSAKEEPASRERDRLGTAVS